MCLLFPWKTASFNGGNICEPPTKKDKHPVIFQLQPTELLGNHKIMGKPQKGIRFYHQKKAQQNQALQSWIKGALRFTILMLYIQSSEGVEILNIHQCSNLVNFCRFTVPTVARFCGISEGSTFVSHRDERMCLWGRSPGQKRHRPKCGPPWSNKNLVMSTKFY